MNYEMPSFFCLGRVSRHEDSAAMANASISAESPSRDSAGTNTSIIRRKTQQSHIIDPSPRRLRMTQKGVVS